MFKCRNGSAPGLSRMPWYAAGMKPALQLRGPFVGVDLVSVITTNAGRFSFAVPSP